MSEWWNKNSKIPLTNSNFQKIIDFYLFNCPSETKSRSKKKNALKYKKVSNRAKTLREQGWTDRKLSRLLSMMKSTSSGHLEYCICKGKDNITAKCLEIEEKFASSDKEFEMIIIAERSDMNLTSAIFYYIRNAFAHGAFSVIGTGKKRAYYLESSQNGDVRARIRLREQTLLDWISYFNSSPEDLQYKQSKKEKGGKTT